MSIPPPPIPRENPGAGLPYGALEHAAGFLVKRQQARLTGVYLSFATIVGLGSLGAFSLLIRSLFVSIDDSPGLPWGVFFLPALLLLVGSIVFVMHPSRRGVLLVHRLFLSMVAVLILANVFSIFVLDDRPTEAVAWQGRTALLLGPLCSLMIFRGIFPRLKRLLADDLFDTSPSPLALTLAGDLLNRLRDASLRNDPAFFEFAAGNHVFRGLLLEETAVVAEFDTFLHPHFTFRMVFQEVGFLRPSGLRITPDTPPAGRTWTRCALQVDGNTAPGAIAAESFARYQAWQARYGTDGG